MIDQPGPWGTGVFTLVEGYSSMVTKGVVIRTDPYAATWMIEGEERTPRLVLERNADHWNNAERGARIERAVFVNDLPPDDALTAVCDREGEVDILTEVSPADAQRVLDSEHATLVTMDANRVLVGIINRYQRDVPLGDVAVRRALNRAVDKARVIAEGLGGYANELCALTPAWCSGYPEGAVPYAHDAAVAREEFDSAAWPEGRPLRLATPGSFAGIAAIVADGIRDALGVDVEVSTIDENAGATMRQLIEKTLPPSWDVLLHGWFDLSSEAPPAAVHREFFGGDGAWRAGPTDERFDELYEAMATELDGEKMVAIAEQLDQHCYDEALALFLCAPQSLYAVNRHVTFDPYRTTFELAETEVGAEHWSRRNGGSVRPVAADSGAEPAVEVAATTKPGFSGAAGNAC